MGFVGTPSEREGIPYDETDVRAEAASRAARRHVRNLDRRAKGDHEAGGHEARIATHESDAVTSTARQLCG